MNIHHLELFYYVAKHRGVSAAARRIPYGIQQPAISAQIIQLEDNLGVMLFHRRPFQLTKAGEDLYRFIEPFFGGIDEVAKQMRGGVEVSLRIGAPETVLRAYLPRLLQAMRRRLPELKFALTAAGTTQIEASLLTQEIDIGVAPLLDQRAEGVRQKELARVPMALLVAKGHKLTSADELWRQDRIAEPLIAGPADGGVSRVFQLGLQKRKVEWFPSVELHSQDLIAHYVAEGFGIGLVLAEPGTSTPAGVRLLPLPGFPTIPYGLLWAGFLSPLQKTFLQEAQAIAAQLAEK